MNPLNILIKHAKLTAQEQFNSQDNMKKNIIFTVFLFNCPAILTMQARILLEKKINASTKLVELLKEATVSKESVEELITLGASTNKYHDAGNFYETPLHTAAKNGHAEACKVLLQHGACSSIGLKTKNFEDIDKSTALIFASENGNEAVCQIILEHGYQPASELVSCLAKASGKQNDSLYRLFMSYGYPAIHLRYLDQEKKQLINQLISLFDRKNVSYNDVATKINDETPFYCKKTIDNKVYSLLSYAVQKNHLEACRALLSQKKPFMKKAILANGLNSPKIYQAQAEIVDVCINQALFIACLSMNLEIIKLLIEHGANTNISLPANYPDNNGHLVHDEHVTPLKIAAYSNDSAMIKLLLSKGATVCQKNRFNSLCLAIRYDNYQAVETLIEHATLPQEVLDEGLYECVISNKPFLSKRLVQSGASLTSKSKRIIGTYISGPLMIAADNGYSEVCSALLQSGGPIDATILKAAAWQGHLEACKALIYSARFLPEINTENSTIELQNALCMIRAFCPIGKKFPKDICQKILTYMPEAQDAIYNFTLSQLTKTKKFPHLFLPNALQGFMAQQLSQIATLIELAYTSGNEYRSKFPDTIEIFFLQTTAHLNSLEFRKAIRDTLHLKLQTSEQFRNEMLQISKEFFNACGVNQKLDDETVLHHMDSLLEIAHSSIKNLSEDLGDTSSLPREKLHYTILAVSLFTGLTSGLIWLFIEFHKKMNKANQKNHSEPTGQRIEELPEVTSKA